jgi:4-amino-4-deoxy-L-arabinose transferase-like glycosyltransferase
MVQRGERALFVMALLLCAWAFGYADALGRLPGSVHAWRQADALSLAMNFHADQGTWTPRMHFQHSDGGRGVGEFPLTYYICAGSWTLIGREQPAMLPLLHLLLGWMGVWALYRWARERTESVPAAAVAAGAVALTPLAAYYAGNYLVNFAALGAVFVGWWAGWRAVERPGRWGWVAATAAAFALAILWRPTMGIGLVPVAVKAWTTRRWEVGAALAVAVAVGAAWVAHATAYNRAAGSVYFLTTVRPWWESADPAAVWEQLRSVRIPEWGTRATRALVVGAAVVGAAVAVRRRRWPAVAMGTGVMAGLGVYFALWYSNLDVHDYYLIEGLLVPPLAVVGAAAASKEWGPRRMRGVWAVCAVVLAVQIPATAARTRAKRGETDTRLAAVFVPGWLREEYAWLAWDERRRLDPLAAKRGALHRLLGSDAVVLSFPDPTPNLTLTRMDLHGFTDLYENDLMGAERCAHFAARGATHLVVNDTAALGQYDWGPWLDRPVVNWGDVRVYDLRRGE